MASNTGTDRREGINTGNIPQSPRSKIRKTGKTAVSHDGYLEATPAEEEALQETVLNIIDNLNCPKILLCPHQMPVPDIPETDKDLKTVSSLLASDMTEEEVLKVYSGLQLELLNEFQYFLTSETIYDTTCFSLTLSLILLANDEAVHNKALGLAKQTVDWHPPIGKCEVQYYLNAMKDTLEELSQDNISWLTRTLKVYEDIYEDAKEEEEFEKEKLEKSLLAPCHLLEVLTLIMEVNMAVWQRRLKAEGWPLVVHMFDLLDSAGGVNATCKHLVKVYGLCIQLELDVELVTPLEHLIECLAHALIVYKTIDEMYVTPQNRIYPLAQELAYVFSGSQVEGRIVRILPQCLRQAVSEIVLLSKGVATRQQLCSFSGLLEAFNGLCESSQASNNEVSEEVTKSKGKTHYPPGKKQNVSKRNSLGETALHLACKRNNVEKVRELLALPGIDLNAPDNAGWTPLHEAVNKGHVECVRELLEAHTAGKRPLDLRARADDNKTPLIDAAESGHGEVCRLLLKYGGNSLLNDRTLDGKSALEVATTDVEDLLYEVISENRNSSEAGKVEFDFASLKSISGIEDKQREQMVFLNQCFMGHTLDNGAINLKLAMQKDASLKNKVEHIDDVMDDISALNSIVLLDNTKEMENIPDMLQVILQQASTKF